MSKDLRKRLLIYIVQIIICFALSILIFNLMGDFLNGKNYDFLVKNVGGKVQKPSDDVILLLIDEASMKYGEQLGLGKWPWPREIYPEIIDFINKTDPPKAIFFDIHFVDSDRTKPENDPVFAGAVAASGNIYHNVILSIENQEDIKSQPESIINKYWEETKNSGKTDYRRKLPPDVISNFTIQVKDKNRITFKMLNANDYSIPIPCLRSNVACTVKNVDFEKLSKVPPIAKGIGVAVFNSDSDGVYRRGRILFNYGDYFFPSFSLAAIMAYTSTNDIAIGEHNNIIAGKYEIPVDESGHYLINYYAKNRIPQYSMSAVMESSYYMYQGQPEKMKIKPGDFKDKIVIIGVSASGGQDLKNTPMDGKTPGPEIHANLISNILQGNHISQQSTAAALINAFIAVVICSAIILFIRNQVIQAVGVFLLMGIYAGANTVLFRYTNYLNQSFFIMLSGFMSSVVSFIYLSMTEGAEKRKYSKILGHMIDPTVVKEALTDLESLKKGGEKEITAFFSDVASFSAISEKLSSVDLAALLNEYLSAMTLILKHHGGTLDKYIGDAIVGIFGAPVELPSNPLAAAEASIEMREKIKELQQKWTRDNAYCLEAQSMHFRIGLNTGPAKVGFMGTSELASYTMMGDTVNLASRLEAAGKDYGVDNLVSENTKKFIDHKIFVRKIDAVRVKGKIEPVSIFEMIGHINEVDDDIKEATALYEEAFSLYTSRNWDAAISKFKKARKIRKDLASEILVKRCLYYKEQPPKTNWDGVFTRTHK